MRRLLARQVRLIPAFALVAFIFTLLLVSQGDDGPSTAVLWKRFDQFAGLASQRYRKLPQEGQDKLHRHRRLESHSPEQDPVAYNGPPLRDSDFLVALPGTKSQELLFVSGRAARKGVKTYYAVSHQPDLAYSPIANESWHYYPDDNPQRSWYPGDSRAALMKFLAFRDLPEKNFKWVFYGDDDTLFFVEAAKSLLQGYDPSIPYFITDNLWFSESLEGYHPHPHAPRCLPCHSTTKLSQLPIPMARGCPCKPEPLCRAAGYDRWDVKGCKGHGVTYSMHGGAGALVSIGLLEQVKFEDMESCVLRQHDSGGDAFLSTCLWEQGIGFTTPDLFDIPNLPSGFTAFDPNPADLHPDDFTINKASMALGPMLLQAAGHCHGPCKSIITNTVSLHLRSRRTGGSQEGAAAYVRAFSRLAWRLRMPKNASSVELRGQWNDTLDTTPQALADAVDQAIDAAIVGSSQMADILAEAFREQEPNLGGSANMQSTADSLMYNTLLLEAVKTITDYALREIQSVINVMTHIPSTNKSCKADVNVE